jgi:hypothetical protein
MKKITTLFTTLVLTTAIFLSNHTKAQSSCTWAKKAGNSLEDLATSVATDASGNVYTVGEFFSQTMVIGTTTLHNQAYINGEAEMFVAKFDACGKFKWAKQAGGNDLVRAKSVATDASGNVVVAGYFRADTLHFGTSSIKLINTSSTDAFVAKYDSTGNVIWATQGKGNAQDQIYSVATDLFGNVYIAGGFASTALTIGTFTLNNFDNNSNDDAFIAKLDGNGSVQWVKGGIGDYQDEAFGVSTDASGNVYACGTFGSSSITFGAYNAPLSASDLHDIFVVKYNSNGVEQWLRKAGGNEDDNEAMSIATDAGGNSYITGYIGTSHYSGTPISFGTFNLSNASYWPTTFITKYDASGTEQWAHGSGSDAYTRGNLGNNIKLDNTGNPYLIGSFSSDSLNLGPVTLYNNALAIGGGDTILDVFVAKYKANGSLSWARSAGGAGNDFGLGIATDANNDVYICGEYQSTSITFADTTLNAVNTNGDAFITNKISISPITPQICLVSDDSIIGSNQYNVVYWDKTPYTTATKFIIYREVTSGIYKKIGAQPYSALSLFVDTARSIGSGLANGDPNVTTYRYKLQILDTSGTYSFMSPYHNTIYIQNNAGTFTWNLYTVGNPTVTPVSNYYLMRDNTNTGNWLQIGATTGTGTVLNDPNYANYQATANWRIDADGFNCNPTLRLANGANSTMASKVASHSNQNNNRQAGIKQVLNSSNVSVYPNPNKGSFTIETPSTEKQTLQIFDVNGNIVFTQTINGNTSIDVNNLADGVYNVNIIGNGSMVNKRLVIVK